MEQNLSIKEKEVLERRKINFIIKSIILIIGEITLIVLSFIKLPIFTEGKAQANRYDNREEGYAKWVKTFSLLTKFDNKGDMYIVCIFIGFIVLTIFLTIMALFTKKKPLKIISNILFIICWLAFLTLCAIGIMFYEYY